MAASNKHRPTVIIVGAGLTGLLAAHGLQQNGFRVVVFEKEASIDARPREWTMLVHWAMPIFERLVPKHILRDFNDSLCNPHLEFNAEMEKLPCYNGITGDILFASPVPGSRRVSRRRLRALLAQDVDIKWNMPLKSISKTENGIRAEFESGESIEGEYLLGADGSSSRVRELLLGPDKAKTQGSGFLFATGTTNYGDADKVAAIEAKHPVAALMMGTSSVGAVGVLSADNASDKSTWSTFWVKIWRGEPINLQGQEALDYIRDHTVPLRDVFQSAIDWTPANSHVSVNEMKTWTPVPWDNHGGRVTLAGDAAHPMLIYRGQGFQHSITDVDNYIAALRRLQAQSNGAPTNGALTNGALANATSYREEVMTAHDNEVIARGATAVKQSLLEAEKSMDIETVKNMLMVTKGHGK